MISPTSSRTSCSTTWEPMKPAPPMTRTRRPRKSISLPPVERSDAVHHVGLLLRGQLGVHRQRHGLVRGPLGFGKVAGPVSQVTEALLEVKGHGVVDLGADALRGEELPQRVALRGADDELVVDVGADPGG